MNISLGDHFAQLLRKKVDSGRYRNAAEVVREGLRLLEARDERRQTTLQALRAHIDEGYQQSLRGESSDGEEFFKKLLNGDLDESP